MKKFYRNPIFWLGLATLTGALAYSFLAPGEPQVFSLVPESYDGRCTGFPNGIGKFQWGHCCVEHDLGGGDLALITCLALVLPPWALPLGFLGMALMGFCRPIYNLGQKMRIWK